MTEEIKDKTTEVKTEVVEEKRETLQLPDKKDDKLLDIDNMSEEEIEKEAKKWGHIPKEDHRGDPAKWQDPKEFLERSIRETPSLIKQNRKQNQVIETQKKIIENLKKSIEKERAALEPKMKEAFENSDYEEYRRLQKEDDLLVEQKKDYETQIIEPETDNNEKYAEEANKWLQSNPDYFTDPVVKQTADKAFDKFRTEYPDATPQQIIKAVNIEVQSQKASSFKSTQSTPSVMKKATKERSYNNLTESARKACTNFVAMGASKEDYIKYADDDCFVWGQ